MMEETNSALGQFPACRDVLLSRSQSIIPFGNSLALLPKCSTSTFESSGSSNNSLQDIKMAPPSQLAIATSAVNRLVKEEASYHKELEQQQARIEKLKQASSDEENAEWNLKQEVCDS